MNRTDVSDKAIRQALADSQARLELATSAAGLGVWDWDLVSNTFIYSDRAKEIFGFAANKPVTYEMVTGATHPRDVARTQALSAKARDPAIRDKAPFEYRIFRTDGQMRWVQAHGEAVFKGSKAVRYVGTIQDITDHKQVAQELSESNTRLRLAMDAGRMAVWDVDLRTGMLTGSPELNRLLGYPEDAAPTLDEVRARYWPSDRDRVREIALMALTRGERYFEVEFRYEHPDGGVRWVQLRAEIVEAKRVIGIVLDITQAKEAEERLKLLAREVDHRANNLLAVAQATVKFAQGDTVEALKDTIGGRIAALGHAHSLLSDSRWEGADLRRLIEEELKPYAGERVRLGGADIALRPDAAQSVAMALHELATNAVKYGALSTEAGQVAVDWIFEAEGDLQLRWTETGAAGVKPPEHRGFGLTMVERAVAQLKGAAQFYWRPDGLTCEIVLPAGRIMVP